jgi:hypothetical protein
LLLEKAGNYIRRLNNLDDAFNVTAITCCLFIIEHTSTANTNQLCDNFKKSTYRIGDVICVVSISYMKCIFADTTDPDQTIYKVESGDTCVAISAAQNVSTLALINLNSLDMGCTHIVLGLEICPPDVYEVYCVQKTDTIDSIAARLFR